MCRLCEGTINSRVGRENSLGVQATDYRQNTHTGSGTLFPELSSARTLLSYRLAPLGSPGSPWRTCGSRARFIAVDQWHLHNSVFRKSLLVALEFFQKVKLEFFLNIWYPEFPRDFWRFYKECQLS